MFWIGCLTEVFEVSVFFHVAVAKNPLEGKAGDSDEALSPPLKVAKIKSLTPKESHKAAMATAAAQDSFAKGIAKAGTLSLAVN